MTWKWKDGSVAALQGAAGLVFDRAKLSEMPLAVIQLIRPVERVQIEKEKRKKSLSENGSNQPLITAEFYYLHLTDGETRTFLLLHLHVDDVVPPGR